MLSSFASSAELIPNPAKLSDSNVRAGRCSPKTTEASAGKDFLETLDECIGKTAPCIADDCSPLSGENAAGAQAVEKGDFGTDVLPEETISAIGIALVDAPTETTGQIDVLSGAIDDATTDVTVTKAVAELPVEEKTGSLSLGIEISDSEIETAETDGRVVKTVATSIKPQESPVDPEPVSAAEPRKTGIIQEPRPVAFSAEKVTSVGTGSTDQELSAVGEHTRGSTPQEPPLKAGANESNPQGEAVPRVSVDASTPETMETSRSMRPGTMAEQPVNGLDADLDEGVTTYANRVAQTAEVFGEGEMNAESDGPKLKSFGGNLGAGSIVPDASAAETVPFSANSSRIERFQTHLQAQSTETAPQKIESDSIQEIVEKAVWSVRNGQSEVRIALKPDHLGHVRMLIATEAQQVSVRIFTDAVMTKDLIESHMQQLKNELEQQGLRVEQMDVLVAGEEYQPGTGHHAREKTGKQMFRQPGHTNGREEQTGNEERETDEGPRRNTRSEGIDYFA